MFSFIEMGICFDPNVNEVERNCIIIFDFVCVCLFLFLFLFSCGGARKEHSSRSKSVWGQALGLGNRKDHAMLWSLN